MTSPHAVESEIAYDLLQDHLDLILTLIDAPLPREEVDRRAGSTKTVERMLRYGLIRARGTVVEAVSSTYSQIRQDGMVSFLERYVLPSLASGDHANLQNLLLFLDDAGQRSLLPGPVQRFFEECSELADAPLQGPRARLSVLVIGADKVQDPELEAGESALRHLRCASIKRSTANTRDRAIVSQFDCVADLGRFTSIQAATERFTQSFAPVEADQANYQLTVASHWRVSAPKGDLQ
ncbi:MAG: hypothetical protein AAFU77_02885 [Myxococcota bacterium]